LDSSDAAIELASRAAVANGVAGICEFRRGDAMAELAQLAEQRQQFRLVVADPPAFVKSRKDLAAGLKGYRKLAQLAAAVVEPEGFLFLASCSHNVEPAAFVGEVARGVAAGGRTGRVIREGRASADHPVHLQLPETAYLKSLLLQLD
jgi:23S rRNA (cytosine1962-C5)-methyltransferase